MSTTNKIAQVIRKIVREEVQKEVRSVLNEQKTNSVPVDEMNTGLKHALGLQDSVERRVRRPKKQVKYTKNKMLNSILNETAGDLATGRESRIVPEAEGYPTMGGDTLTSNNAQGFDRNSLAAKMGYGDMTPTGTPTVQEMIPQRNTSGGVSHNTEVDPSVAKALTRDYSELVKKFKK